jgi:16S rRNA (uracil1498-N3)-methyltransferase
MSERFFSSQPITADRVTLDGTEAHHLLNVMRAGVGTTVILFDDSGAEFSAVVESLRRGEANLRILDRREIDRELPFPLTVGVALPKGNRQKWLVEKLTELGVTKLVPIITDRSVAEPTRAAIERLERGIVEASKQSGRNRLMRIAKPQAWIDWIRTEQAELEVRRLFAHPGGKKFSENDLRILLPTQIAIGPEGGFTDTEVAAAHAARWQSVDLGPRLLRVETAAVALAAAIVMR